MAFSVTICLTTPTTDADNFSIYHTSGITGNLLHSGITKSALENYVVTGIPDGTTRLVIKSMNDCPCSVSIDLVQITPTPTPTPTPMPLCDIVITKTLTTNPTNQAGTNGTATITYTSTNQSTTYTLNGVSQGTCSSPLTITGLSANTEYTVVIKDSNNCTAQTIFNVGQTIFTFDADYMMLTYEFSDGLDLDTRTRIVSPNVGQTAQSTYIGWSCQSYWPNLANQYLTWSGDNTGTGFESVLVDINTFSLAYPSTTEMVMDLRGFWFNQVGVNLVNVAVKLWKGGSPVKNGFIWDNPTATSTYDIDSVGKQVTDQGLPNKSLASGERIAVFRYNLVTGEGLLDNNDVTTPSV